MIGCSSHPPLTPEQREARELQRERIERAEAQESLRHRFAAYSTAELLIMRENMRSLYLAGNGTEATHNPAISKIWAKESIRQLEEINRIERELLRRFNLGDREADIHPKG